MKNSTTVQLSTINKVLELENSPKYHQLEDFSISVRRSGEDRDYKLDPVKWWDEGRFLEDKPILFH